MQIFSAKTSESEPPKTVKSWLEDDTAAERAVAGDDRVAVGPVSRVEAGVAVARVAVELDEGARVEQLLDPLAREQLAALVLARDRLLASGVLGPLAQLLEPGELRRRRLVGGHRRSLTSLVQQ